MSAAADRVDDVPSETREVIGSGRHGVVGQLLAEGLASLRAASLRADSLRADPGAERPGVVSVLDCGGGSGSFAVPLAVAGASVTVVDVSADALATLMRRADEAGARERVRPVQGDVEALAEVIAAATFDLVLAHGVLQAVDDPGAAFAAIVAAVRPGGLLSVLVDNPVAGVLARAIGGDVVGALSELRGLDGSALRLGPAAVRALCEDSGFVVEQVHGVGVFADWVSGPALERPEARAALAALEAETAERRPFADIAARVHLLARRPED